MKISPTMDLNDLAACMGYENMANEEIDWRAVRDMRSMLADDYDGQDTADIDEGDWLTLIDRSAGA